MNEEYKFDIGDEVEIDNVKGDLHRSTSKIKLRKEIGKRYVIKRCNNNNTYDRHYLLHLDIGRDWWFHEHNLTQNGINARSIVRKAFNLSWQHE